MSYFYFGKNTSQKTSDTGLVFIFPNDPEKSGLDETTTEQVERQFGSCTQGLFVSGSQPKQREVLGRIQQASAFILELFNTFANDPDDGMQSVLIKSAGDNKLQEVQEQDWNSKLCQDTGGMVGKTMLKFIRDSCKI